MIRSPFKTTARRPQKLWDGESMPTPRLPVVCGSALDLVAVQPILKEEPVRSESYRRYVASFQCSDCKIEGWSQCAHENMNKGMTLKACDLRTFPLCGPRYGLLGCHQQFDLGLGRSREVRRLLGLQWVERMQAQARADHRPEFA